MIKPAISAITGSFAPQGMFVTVIIVIRRSFSFSIVRVAMIPGTPHPDPIRNGMNDFPERPNLRNIRSMIKATRAMYPQSSRIERNRNTIAICGANPIGAPIPPMIPSTTNDTNHSEHPAFSISDCTPGCIHSPKSVSFVQSVTIPPSDETAT